PGTHMVMNACVSAAIGENLGMSIEDIKKGLASAATISGRLNLIKNGDGYIIDDCYNAAPLSMKASVDTLCLAKGKKVAILGDMFELGKDTETMHAEVGAYAASKPIDKYVFVGELGECMYKAAKEKAPDKDMEYFKTLDDCLSALDKLIALDDNVLVKASNGMHFSKIVEKFKS
ncbi:MAG: UDP-N-acetylmuramoyl-tripeptide--D-alanyl-D-alanine ligase, partial [Lachnospiraceae bacterium]|nr:UDP-N-acetylmuramoyl-tripeptide--D-alanyl-D-alanine ligase [Lachnospiraceae bacterium]